MQLYLSFHSFAWGAFMLKFTPPKRRFWKAEQTFQSAFSTHFSRSSTRFGILIVEKCFPGNAHWTVRRTKKWRNFTPPKRRFWKEEQKIKCGFRRKHFSRSWVLDLGYESLKTPSKIYPSQTKILECWTSLSEYIFETLFKGVSTRFGLRIVEKCFEKSFWNAVSAFQNLRLGSIKSAFHLLFLLPKSSFGEHKFRTHYLTKELAYVSYSTISPRYNGH